MKAVLMSIKPRWCELIASGKKTVEVRKTKPKIETPFKCYIYMTKGKPDILKTIEGNLFEGEYIEGENLYGLYEYMNGKVIGEFVCDFVDEYKYAYCTHPEIGMDYDCGDSWWEIADEDLENACLTYEEFKKYVWGYREVYGWHISNLVIYDKPRELGEFLVYCENCRKKFVGFPNCWKGCFVRGSEKPPRPPQSWCYVEEVL